jgi:hypothetical protein
LWLWERLISLPVSPNSGSAKSSRIKAFGDRLFQSLTGKYPVDAGSDRRALPESTFTDLVTSTDFEPVDRDFEFLIAPEVADARSVEGNEQFAWSGLFDIEEAEMKRWLFGPASWFMHYPGTPSRSASAGVGPVCRIHPLNRRIVCHAECY